jgi:hypothetical protein
MCLTDAIARYVSIEWSQVCDKVNTWTDEDGTVYEIGFTPNDSDTSDHVYCWACGDLVGHGDGSDEDNHQGRVCTSDGCTWPEFVKVPEYFEHPLA